MGIANDGDADRIAVVTPERGVLDANLFYAACYDRLLENDSGPAVRTVSTTFLVDRIAEAHGEEVYETPVGFKWVAEAMGEHDALFGGEESGGFTLRGHVREKDGVLMALLAAAAPTPRAAVSTTGSIACSTSTGRSRPGRCRSTAPTTARWASSPDLEDHIPESVAGHGVAKVVTLDGFKLLLENGSWLLVRPSGTGAETTGVRRGRLRRSGRQPARRGPRDRRAADLSARAIPPVAPSIGADVRQLSVPPCVRLEYI